MEVTSDLQLEPFSFVNESVELEKILLYENWILNVTNDNFWTPYQKFLMKHVPWQLHIALGIIVGLIGVIGTFTNGLVLLIFSKFKKLRTPANIFVINLAISDLSAALLHPLAAYSSFHGHWAFGKTACHMYAMGVGFFGLNSIVTLAAVAFERYLVITSQPVSVRCKITRSRARKICVMIWLYCLCLVVPPLVGWSSYVPEGLLTTCSWDYTTRTLVNRSYYIYLLVLGFLVPVSVISVCYWSILRVVTCHGREMTHLAAPPQKSSFRKRRLETDMRTAHAIVTLVILYLITWTPYAVVSLIGQFGPPAALSPLATAVPAFFAKGAVVFDPIVYGFSHPHFRMSLHQYFHGTVKNTISIPAADHPVLRQSNFASSDMNPSPRIVCEYSPSTRYSWNKKSRAVPVTRLEVQSEDSRPRTGLTVPNRSNWYSEPDLMRSGSRIIPGAALLTYSKYRQRKRTFLHRVFFRSESVLVTTVEPDNRQQTNRRKSNSSARQQSMKSLESSVGTSGRVGGRSYSLKVPRESRRKRKIDRKRRSVHCENCCECAQRSTPNDTVTFSSAQESGNNCFHNFETPSFIESYLESRHSLSYASASPLSY